MHYEDFKYEHPVLHRLLMIIFGVGAALAICVALPDNDATRAMGLVDLKERFTAFRSAVYWETRAAINPGSTLTPTIDYGFVLGVDFDGGVFISVPVNKEFVQRKVKFADIQIVDLQGVANLVSKKHQLDAKIESYGDMAVIWFGDEPLNVELVTAKVAVPDPNPPTNIVDRTFAAYFWQKVKGVKKK